MTNHERAESSGSPVLEKLRRYEVERVRKWFDPAKTVLEIGGADGLQAGVIASWGCPIRSIDIADRPSHEKTYHRVETYDGSHIPFPEASFDIVFSSNVLEHVRDPSSLLAETFRVLKNDGLCIQILPSTTWRFWTMATHYPSLLLRAFRKIGGGARPPEALPGHASQPPGVFIKLKNALLPPPHGEYANAFSELYYYSASRWSRVFQEHGFRIVQVEPAGLFYTGYCLCPALPMALRHTLASFAGSASLIYILKKKAGE